MDAKAPNTTTTPKATSHSEEDLLFCPICFCSATTTTTTCSNRDEEQSLHQDSPIVEKSTKSTSEDDDRTPPQPREPEVPLISNSACPHAFCLECLDRLFLVTGQNQHQQQQQQAEAPSSNNPDEDDHQGLLLHIHCPICRTLWSYFDLVFPNSSSRPSSSLQQIPVRGPSFTTFPLPAQLSDCEFRYSVRRRRRTPAQPDDASPGYLWFPPPAVVVPIVMVAQKNEPDVDTTTTSTLNPRWYFDSSSTTTTTSTTTAAAASESLDHIELKRHGYHDTFQTWQGESEPFVLVLNDDDNGSTCTVRRWKVIVSFAADWKFVRRGVVFQTTTTTTTTPDPMQQQSPPKQQKQQQIRVLCRMGCGRRECSYVRIDPRPIPVQAPFYNPNTLEGNVFCQGWTVGLASYHFEAPDRTARWEDDESAATDDDHHQPIAYISYQHPDTAHWPSLDNGAPIPAQVYFSDTAILEHHTLFRGTIAWRRQYGTTWQGAEEWQYEMKFASDYSCIVSGTVYSVSSATTELATTPPQRQLLSRYGQDLLYGNAGLWNSLVVQRYSHEPGDRPGVTKVVEQQLIREGATTVLANMISSLYLAAEQGYSSPMEYV